MKPIHHFLRTLLLVWSLLLTTQAALVHGYTHQNQSVFGSSSTDERDTITHQTACGFCLSLHQFESALPTQHDVQVARFDAPNVRQHQGNTRANGPVAAAQARGPPVQS